MSQSDQTAETPQAEPTKKPPAHEVILVRLRDAVRLLTNQSQPNTIERGLAECVITTLSSVLAAMEVPKKDRASVAVELRGLFVVLPYMFGAPRLGLRIASNAITPGSITGGL